MQRNASYIQYTSERAANTGVEQAIHYHPSGPSLLSPTVPLGSQQYCNCPNEKAICLGQFSNF